MINRDALKLTLSLVQEDEEYGYKFSSKLFAIPLKIKIVRAKSTEKIPQSASFFNLSEIFLIF